MATRRTLLDVSTAVHLDAVVRLEPQRTTASHEVAFAPFDGQQLRVLSTQRQLYIVYPFPPQGLPEALPTAPRAFEALRASSFTDVVFTGSATAVPFPTTTRLRNLREYYYIESAAHSDGPRLSFPLVAHLTSICLDLQYVRWADAVWHHECNVFDHFVLAESHRPPGLRSRVVDTLGNMRSIPFQRDGDAACPPLENVPRTGAEVLRQAADTAVEDLGIYRHGLTPGHEMRTDMTRPGLVLSHAGIGPYLPIPDKGRASLQMPRRRAGTEHIDDRLLLIAAQLNARDLAVSGDLPKLTPDDTISAMRRNEISECRNFSLSRCKEAVLRRLLNNRANRPIGKGRERRLRQGSRIGDGKRENNVVGCLGERPCRGLSCRPSTVSGRRLS